MQIDISPGKVLMVKGPASVISVEGEMSTLGTNLGGGKVLVRHGKILPFECVNPARAIITLGSYASYSFSYEKVGIKIWKDVVKSIETSRPRKIVLLGGTDSGKSTLTVYLANLAHRRGDRVGIVDGDVGQSDLVPPTCVGATKIDHPLTDLRDIEAERIEFVGSTSPQNIENLVVEKIQKLTNYLESKDCNHLIINTDGLVGKEGADYKSQLVAGLNPDFIVCIKGETSELYDRLVKTHGTNKTLIVDGPEGVSKARAERVERRLLQYRRFLLGSKSVTANFHDVNLSFLGKDFVKPLKVNQGIAKTTFEGETLRFVASTWIMIRIIRSSGSITFPSNHIHGMFVGLSLGREIIGFGLVEELYPDGRLLIQTPVIDNFDTLHLSTSRLLDGMTKEETLETLLI